eukprot:403353704
MMSTESRGFVIENLNELNREHSPSIPHNFPKERLPNELCEKAFLFMTMCVFQKPTNACGPQNKQYYECRRERDAYIFHQIKDWETEEVQKLNTPFERQNYLKELEQKKLEIMKKFEKTPQSINNKHKRWRMAADIEQYQWRTDNIKDLVTDIKKQPDIQ